MMSILLCSDSKGRSENKKKYSFFIVKKISWYQNKKLNEEYKNDVYEIYYSFNNYNWNMNIINYLVNNIYLFHIYLE